ncbi:hypothetical protein DFH06DRAFT_1199883 [Mycena polygramma]|nr:hypothetical protein DFH06DRAFT_1199883 [Mycena polygramma]
MAVLLLLVGVAEASIYLWALTTIYRHGIERPAWGFFRTSTPTWVCADILDIGRPTAASPRTSMRKRCRAER